MDWAFIRDESGCVILAITLVYEVIARAAQWAPFRRVAVSVDLASGFVKAPIAFTALKARFFRRLRLGWVSWAVGCVSH